MVCIEREGKEREVFEILQCDCTRGKYAKETNMRVMHR